MAGIDSGPKVAKPAHMQLNNASDPVIVALSHDS